MNLNNHYINRLHSPPPSLSSPHTHSLTLAIRSLIVSFLSSPHTHTHTFPHLGYSFLEGLNLSVLAVDLLGVLHDILGVLSSKVLPSMMLCLSRRYSLLLLGRGERWERVEWGRV